MCSIIKLSLPWQSLKSSQQTSFDHFNIIFGSRTSYASSLTRFCGFLITIKNILTIKNFDNKFCALNFLVSILFLYRSQIKSFLRKFIFSSAQFHSIYFCAVVRMDLKLMMTVKH